MMARVGRVVGEAATAGEPNATVGTRGAEDEIVSEGPHAGRGVALSMAMMRYRKAWVIALQMYGERKMEAV